MKTKKPKQALENFEDLLQKVELFSPSISITWSKTGHNGPGYYVHSTDYPNEGSEFLGEPTPEELIALLEHFVNRDGWKEGS